MKSLSMDDPTWWQEGRKPLEDFFGETPLVEHGLLNIVDDSTIELADAWRRGTDA